MQKRFDLIVCDLDGTLIDNRYAIRENFNYTRNLYGYSPLLDSQIDSMIGTPLLEMFEKTLPASDKHLASELARIYKKRYTLTRQQRLVILDGVITTLKILKNDKFKLAVATTKANDQVHPLLEKIGLYRYFDLVVGFNKKFRTKPYPDMVQYLMKELDAEPVRTVLVGDTPTDVHTARNAGTYSITVKTGISLGMTTLDEVEKAGPDIIIDFFSELPNHLYI